MLKKTRIFLSVIFFGLITFYFLDFAELLPNQFHVLAHVQFVPALLSLSFIILAVLIVMNLLFGRIYCSIICPMGIFQDIITWFSKKTGRKRKRFNYSPAKTILRWSTLAVTIIAFFLGFRFVLGLLDPYSAFGRMVVNVFKPLYMLGNNALESVFSQFNNYTFYQIDASILSISAFCIGIATFGVIGFLAWKYGRSWCNTMCPVGTILGFLSRFSLLKVRIDSEKCNHCGLCATKCKASCINSSEQTIDYSRCIDCFDCLGECRQQALQFTLPKGIKVKTSDVSRRHFILTGLTTVAVAPKAMAQAQSAIAIATGKKNEKRQTPITPPGSVSKEHFQAHCTSCHLCVSKCPSHVLKPAFMEYGLEGMMQPTLFFDKGFCNFDCTVCGDICPNGAILPLTKEQKHLTQIGKVHFVKENCIVHIDGTNCGACSEHCPTQAVAMVPYKDGLTIPHINPDICVGCGGCEFICPVRPFKAIYIEGNVVQQQAKPFIENKEEKVKVDDFGF